MNNPKSKCCNAKLYSAFSVLRNRQEEYCKECHNVCRCDFPTIKCLVHEPESEVSATPQKPMTDEQPYILTQDEDCHWYVIPSNKATEWDKWCQSPNYGEEDLPKWAKEVGGSPTLVKFSNYIIE